MWCCLDMAKHIRLARTHFFSLSRLSMGVPSALAWHALRRPCGYVVGTVLPDDPASPALRWHTACEGIDKPATHFVKKCVGFAYKCPPLAVDGMPRPPPPARFWLEGSERHQEADVKGYPAHVVLFGHGEAYAKHIRLARSHFFSLSVPSALAWHALRRPCGYVVGAHLSWQLTTSDPKDSTPVRDSLLGTALEKPHTIVLACGRRSFEYSTERVEPLAYRHMSSTCA